MVSEPIFQSRTGYVITGIQFLCLLAGGFCLSQELYLGFILLLMAAILCFLMLHKIQHSMNQYITLFFHSLKNNDTSFEYPLTIKNKSIRAMLEQFNILKERFQNIRVQAETNEKYYKAIIKHSATGLLVLQDGKVELINNLACRYAGISPESTNKDLLRIKNPAFYDAICQLQPGSDITYKQSYGTEMQILLFRATILKRNEDTVKLVSIQDIRHELESKEVDSYRKLIRVMIHEIMNLMSPLTSVSKALYESYQQNENIQKLRDADDVLIHNTLNSLKVINEQSHGILNFTESYRRIAQVPNPVVKPFEVDEWAEQLKIVFSESLSQKNIFLEITFESSLQFIHADKNLMNQAVINIMNNAANALEEKSNKKFISIEITAGSGNGRIKISNNGPQISAEIQEKIFVPFFTTKKNGSGIGLSIAQEIVRLHKGSLMVFSSGEYTSFVIEL